MIEALLTMRTPKASVEVSQSNGVRTEDDVASAVTLTMASGNARLQEVRLSQRMENLMAFFKGRYATGVTVGKYRAGGLLEVSVEVTANHGGLKRE